MPNYTFGNVEVSKEDLQIIMQIVKRARENGYEIDPISLSIDLEVTHANNTPLKLEELLAAPDYDFFHDIYGIMRHMNRTTGKLEDCFLPRYADTTKI